MTKSDAFLTGILAFIWLGERLSLFQIVCMVMTFGGIVIITFAKQEIESDEEVENIETEERDFYRVGVLLCIAVALIFAINATATRRLKELHFSIIQMYITFANLVISSVWLLIDQRNR